MVNLLELCENLKIEVENLKAENETLRVENAQLKKRFGLNSKNSPIPSSQELYKIKKNKQKSERNIGSQFGHEGNFRTRMKVDKVVEVELPYTCECGGGACGI